jgi:hypothetical protein
LLTAAAIFLDAGGGSGIGSTAANGWWTGTSMSPSGIPSNQRGITSVVVHEWGHALGIKHFVAPDERCDSQVYDYPPCVCFDESGDPDWSGRHTMCSEIYFATTRQRTPNTHDKYALKCMYPHNDPQCPD